MIPVLGTAQFGKSYGITNSGSYFAEKDVFELLQIAGQKKICNLDTSVNYGPSELIIEKFDRQMFTISTKINFREIETFNLKSVESKLQSRAGKHSVSNIFFHDWPDLDYRARSLAYSYFQEGTSLKWGPSIYNETELEEVLDSFSNFNAIQLPTSILDQRFIDYFHRLKDAQIEIWVRSIFLQGLLTRGVNKTQFSKRPEIIKILKICEQVKIDPIQLSLQFIKNLNIDFFIFGVGSVDQFNQVIDFLDEDISFDDFSIFASKDRDLIDPRSWTSKP